MGSNEYKTIVNAMNYIDDHYSRSYDKIRDLKLSGALDYLYHTMGVHDCLGIILKDFMEKLYTPAFNIYPHTRKIILYNYNDLIDCFRAYQYDLGAYLNDNLILFPQNNKIWLSFPRLVKQACKKYGLEPYASMSEVDLENKLGGFLDLNCVLSGTYHRDGNHDEYEVGVKKHSTINKEKYNNYDYYRERNLPFSYMDFYESKNYMSVDAEKRSFEVLYNNPGVYGQTFWVAKWFGDGYGYDILNCNTRYGIENLIEVKSSTDNEYFDLTETEYNVMRYTENLSNTNYYVQKYFYGSNVDEYRCQTFIYDKQRHMLVDVTNPNIVCEIEEWDKTIANGNIVKSYRCTPLKITKKYELK